LTGRERLIKAINREKPDHVPAAPDLWQMVPLRLLGRPSWEVLIHQDPPLWKTQIDAYKHFGVDVFLAVVVPANEQRTVIVYKDEQKIITRDFSEVKGKRVWSPYASVFREREPQAVCEAESIGLPHEHDRFEIVKPAYNKYGKEYFEDVRKYAGEDGIVGPMVHLPSLPIWQKEILRYYDEPEAVMEQMRRAGEFMMEQARTFLSWKPDMLVIGNSGLMITNPPHIFRKIGLEWLQKVTRLAKEHNIPTHIHCCGPEMALAEIAANETDLSSIEPLEIPPMGDCELAEIKRKFGKKLALKGNLHTTEVMLNGTPQQVEDACKKAIDDAAEGGGFILSTGDQTPRDTPDETIRIMQRVAETYGKY